MPTGIESQSCSPLHAPGAARAALAAVGARVHLAARRHGAGLSLVLALAFVAVPPAWADGPSALAAASASASFSPSARKLLTWVMQSRDAAPLPFIVIDKRLARAYAFTPAGELRASAPVLIGAARADHSVPGIGERPLARIRPHERTTPAGRFDAEIGQNLQGEDIVWVDYAAAVSLHRVRVTRAAERRLQRLASPTAADNRISYGCINVPDDFFERIVLPLLQLAGGRAVVYVLPERRPLAEVFAQLVARAAARQPAGAAGRLRADPVAG